MPITVSAAQARLPEMLASVQALVECESPTEDLAACERVVALAQELITTWVSEPARIEEHAGRSVLRWGSPQPEVLLLGHLDTVWPLGTLERIPWRVEDSAHGQVMRGPGVFDMKAGVVQGWAALALLDSADRDRVGMLLTTDEETGSLASREVIADSITNAQTVFVLEPSLDGALKIARKGTSWYTLQFQGKAAHAGLDPHRGINAVVEAAHFITAAQNWGNPELETTVTPTTLSAGTTSNTVPAQAELMLDCRAWTRAEQERVDALVRGWNLYHPEATWQITGGIDRPPMERAASESLFDLARIAASELQLPVPDGVAVGGASDGNLTAAAGIPTLDGLGAVGDGAHADHEWASVSAMPERAALLAELISSQLRLNP